MSLTFPNGPWASCCTMSPGCCASASSSGRATPQLGLTRAQWSVLAHLARQEGINQAALAQILEIEPITLS